MNKIIVKTVSVGIPQEIQIHGSTVRTAILKQPVQDRVYVSEQGLAGNKSAVHPDAVYCFSAENYRYWADQLGVSDIEWKHGFFGENLTLEGLNEASLCVGDMLEIGEELEVMVVGPRVPCFKLAWRLNQPETFLKEFALSGRTGFYCRVLKEGGIKAGDAVELMPQDDRGFTIRNVAALNWQEDDPHESELKKVLDVKELSETSALPLRNRLVRIQDQRRTSVGRWSGWREFIVKKVIDEAKKIRSYTLIPADGDILCGYRPGQFVAIKLELPNQDPLLRTYSLSNYADVTSEYRITVKRLENNSGSSFIHDNLSIGSSVHLQAPVGRFVLDRTSLEPIVLIAGGVGITPLLAMAKAHVERGSSAPMMYFLNCIRNSTTHVFKQELEELGAQSDRLKVINLYSKHLGIDTKGTDYNHSGRLTFDLLEKILENTFVDYCGTIIPVPWLIARFYICGPDSLQTEITGWLIDEGVDSSHISTESFRPLIGDPLGGEIVAAEVYFSKSGLTVEWRNEAGKSLLELAESEGLEPPSSCRFGACHTCQCRLIEGRVHYDHAPASVPDEGQVLLCCSKPGSARVVLDL